MGIDRGSQPKGWLLVVLYRFARVVEEPWQLDFFVKNSIRLREERNFLLYLRSLWDDLY